ncbi:histidine phosphatase family protein [Sulfobacillus thermotolerans]|uniref:histidine phosphatase family protein n=1 Tax=Sulfobacillus thermotolerans TaxID=338644 RepID=UPI003366A0A2
MIPPKADIIAVPTVDMAVVRGQIHKTATMARRTRRSIGPTFFSRQEDREAAIDRISMCLKELMRANPGRSIGVVAHGRILALFYSHMLGRSVSLLEWLSVPVPAVCVIDGDSWKIERAFQYKELSDNNQDW